MSATVPARPDAPLVDQHLKTTSLHIAEKFGKRHDDVLKRIRGLEVPDDFNARNFAAVEYTDSKGESRPAYELTRDGFALLVMGFTGKRAMAWKIKFLEAFNRMEAQLRAPARPADHAADFIEGLKAGLRSKSPEELSAWAHGRPDKLEQVITYIDATLMDPHLSRDARREMNRIHAIASHIRKGGSDR
ncbi:MAG: hypothetical protein EpisKO_15790 [Epibacterium sp.]